MKRSIHFFYSKHFLFTVICCIALSTFMSTPAFASQRGNRGNRSSHVVSGNNRSMNVRSVNVRTNNRSYGVRENFYGRGPSRGTLVNAFPRGGVWRTYGGIRYGYFNGYFYRPYGSAFLVVPPPFGYCIASLPLGFVSFSYANSAYYYYAGTYYQRQNDAYVVVQPPLGALVQSIPNGGQQVIIDGNTYYIVDGVQYQAVMYQGSIWYKVIKIENQVNDYNGASPY